MRTYMFHNELLWGELISASFQITRFQMGLAKEDKRAIIDHVGILFGTVCNLDVSEKTSILY